MTALIIYEEYTILWFESDMCGLQQLQDMLEIFEASQSVKDYLPLGC